VNNVTTQNYFYILSCDTILDWFDTISSLEKQQILSFFRVPLPIHV